VLRIPRYIDNEVTDSGEIVILTRRPRSISQKLFPTSSILQFNLTSTLNCLNR
jgi:hypothetical protein